MKDKKEECIIESIKITNPDKIVFNESKITKKDIALYYKEVSERMLPFLKDRIISTIRCPEGTSKTCFYKKHLEAKGKGFGMIELPNDNGNKEDYYYIKNIFGLISEVQMNTIEFHIWGSKINKLEKPDMIVFDLDPDENMNLETVKEGVRDLKSILDKLSITSFLKTSGGKGYHIVIPLKPSASWKKIREFAKNIAEVMGNTWPNKYTSNVRKLNRKNRIFIDWIRNTRSSTSVAPYSIRIKRKCTVSMPISWDELDIVSPDGILIEEAVKRLKKEDPWKDFFNVVQQIK